jgi:hypothetical protein
MGILPMSLTGILPVSLLLLLFWQKNETEEDADMGETPMELMGRMPMLQGR